MDLAYTALFTVLLMVCAWITVPMTVPFTLQTFGVFAALGLCVFPFLLPDLAKIALAMLLSRRLARHLK